MVHVIHLPYFVAFYQGLDKGVEDHIKEEGASAISLKDTLFKFNSRSNEILCRDRCCEATIDAFDDFHYFFWDVMVF